MTGTASTTSAASSPKTVSNRPALLPKYRYNSALLTPDAATIRSTRAPAMPYSENSSPAAANKRRLVLVRLATWHRLERSTTQLPERIAAAQNEKVRKVAAAQEAGLTTRALPAGELLALVVHLSLLGSDASPVPEPGTASEVRRGAIVAAVRALTAP